MAIGKDGKMAREGIGEEVQHCVFATTTPPELAVQSSGSESMNISPLPKQKCIIRTELSLSKRDFLAKNGKSVRCPRRAKRGGLAQTSLSQPALEFSSAWGEKGRSFTLSSGGHCETWPVDSQRAEHPEEGSQSNRQFSFSLNPVIIFLSSVGHCQLLTISGNRHWQEGQGEG